MESQNNISYTQLLEDGDAHSNFMDCEFVPQTQFEETPQQEATKRKPSKATKQPRQKNFTPTEDVVVISAWLNTSQDAAIGNNQRDEIYWKRVTKYYNENKGKLDPVRPYRGVQSRWQFISKYVGKFQSYHEQVCRKDESGTVIDDKIADAKALYLRLQGSNFLLENCWKILRDEPKWITLKENQAKEKGKPKDKNNKNKRVSDTIDVECDSSAATTLDELPRPPGAKKTKLANYNESIQKHEGIAIQSHLSELKEERRLTREELKREHEERMTLARETLELEKEKARQSFELEKENKRESLELEKEKLRLEQEREDEAIICKDLTTCDEGQRLYYEARRAAIFARMAT